MTTPKEIPGFVHNNVEINTHVHQINIKLVEKLEFKAGQFGWLKIIAEDEELRKPYSIASAPWEEDIGICIKRVKNGRVSGQLCDLAPASKVSFLAPMGVFTLPDNEPDSYVFIGVGTGIAPLRSMIRQLFQKTLSGKGKNTKKQVILLFGTKTAEDILYKEEFEQLSKQENFKYLVTLSREEGELKGHVQNHLDLLPFTHKSTFFVCGLNAMVSAVKEKLQGLGADRKQIHAELYG